MWTKNAVTGQLETSFQAKLVNLSDRVVENSNGTQFRIGTCELPNGKQVSCRIYEKNFSYGMSVGTSYLTKATQYADANGEVRVDLTMSHLTSATRASLDDLGFLGTASAAPAQKSAVANAAEVESF
jgi:hypothetical protein